jgi:putative flippase GtrA
LSEFARFLASGAFNTAATYLLYLGLVRFLPYPVAYSISYGLGVLLSFLLNSLFVFRRPLRWAGLLRYPVVYVVQYLVGLAVLSLGLEFFRLPQWAASGAAVASTVPLTFVLSRWAIVRPAGGAARPEREG